MIVNLGNSNAFSAENLFNKVQLLSATDIQKMEHGILWIHKNLNNAILIGGTAVVNYLHSGRNLTPDLDFLCNNFESLTPILEFNNLVYHNLYDFNNQEIGITIPSLNIDILNKKSVHFILNKFIFKDYSTTIIGNIDCKIISVELLIIQKIMLCRNKDLDDAIALIQANNLNHSKINSYIKELSQFDVDTDAILNIINSFNNK